MDLSYEVVLVGNQLFLLACIYINLTFRKFATKWAETSWKVNCNN